LQCCPFKSRNTSVAGAKECKNCNKGFVSAAHLSLHEDYCGLLPLKTEICRICNKSYTHSSIRRHYLTHQIRYYCTACGKSFLDRSNLQKHRTRKHEEVSMKCARLRCKRCNYSTIDSSNFKRHIGDKHRGDVANTGWEMRGLFSCSLCNYSSAQPSNYKRHLRSNGHWTRKQEYRREYNGRTISCCRWCNYSTIHSSSLKKHVASKHVKEAAGAGLDLPTELVCSRCNFSSLLRANYQRHLRSISHRKKMGEL